jgi:hypothetical protein
MFIIVRFIGIFLSLSSLARFALLRETNPKSESGEFIKPMGISMNRFDRTIGSNFDSET